MNAVFIDLISDANRPPFPAGSDALAGWDNFVTYFRLQYMGHTNDNGVIGHDANPVSIARWNNQMANRRTNNSMEGLNSRMSSKLTAAKNNIWKYIGVLQTENMYQENLIAQSMAPGFIQPQQSEHLRKREREIDRLTLQMENNIITPMQYVLAVSSIMPTYNH